MINYIWLGLIFIAVFLGGYRDIVGQLPKTEPVVLQTFEEPMGLGSATDLPHRSSTRAREGTYSLALPYDLDRPGELAFQASFRIVEDNGTPEALKLWVYPEVGSPALRFEFVGDLGNTFSFTTRAFSKPGWQEITVPFEKLQSTPGNTRTTPVFPVLLLEIGTTFEVESPVQLKERGTLYIDDVTSVWPPDLMVGGDAAGKSWMSVMTKSVTRWAEISIELAIGLIGIMMLWLGLMRVAEEAGLVHLVAKGVKPIMRFLFPQIPPEGDAMGAIVMNVAANMLGLGNAATPLGLKAMQELQEINANKEYASNAMCMLLAINTSSVTIITPTIIAYRAAAGSGNLMQFWPVMIMVTVTSTIVAVTACKFLEKMSIFQVPMPEVKAETETEGGDAR